MSFWLRASLIAVLTASRSPISWTAVYFAVTALTASWTFGSMILSLNATPMFWYTQLALSGTTW
jgi:hypothetical protein